MGDIHLYANLASHAYQSGHAICPTFSELVDHAGRLVLYACNRKDDRYEFTETGSDGWGRCGIHCGGRLSFKIVPHCQADAPVIRNRESHSASPPATEATQVLQFAKTTLPIPAACRSKLSN